MVVTSSDGNRGIVGSCKFKNGKIGLDELSIMMEYAEAMGRFDEKYFYFFQNPVLPMICWRAKVITRSKRRRICEPKCFVIY